MLNHPSPPQQEQHQLQQGIRNGTTLSCGQEHLPRGGGGGRVQGIGRAATSSRVEGDFRGMASFFLRDPFAAIVSSGGTLALGIFRSNQLKVPRSGQGLFSVPNMTPEQLKLPTARVTGSLMHLHRMEGGGGRGEGEGEGRRMEQMCCQMPRISGGTRCPHPKSPSLPPTSSLSS